MIFWIFALDFLLDNQCGMNGGTMTKRIPDSSLIISTAFGNMLIIILTAHDTPNCRYTKINTQMSLPLSPSLSFCLSRCPSLSSVSSVNAFSGPIAKAKTNFSFFFAFVHYQLLLVCSWHLHWQHKCANILNPLAPHCVSPSLYPSPSYTLSASWVHRAIITLTYRSTICAISQSNSASISIINSFKKFFPYLTDWLTYPAVDSRTEYSVFCSKT